jgi:hypothetical protein
MEQNFNRQQQKQNILSNKILNNSTTKNSLIDDSKKVSVTLSPQQSISSATSWVNKTISRTPILAPTTPHEVIAAANRKFLSTTTNSFEKPMAGLVSQVRQGEGIYQSQLDNPLSNPQVALNFTYPPPPHTSTTSQNIPSSTLLQPSAFFSPLPNKKLSQQTKDVTHLSTSTSVSNDMNEPILDAVFEAGIRTPMHELLKRTDNEHDHHHNNTSLETKIPFKSDNISSMNNTTKMIMSVESQYLITPDDLYKRKANVETLIQRYSTKRPQLASAASATPTSALASAFTLADDLVRALSDYTDGLQATLDHEQISSQMKLAAELDIASKEVGAALDAKDKIAEDLSATCTRLQEKEVELEGVKGHFAELLSESTKLAEQVEQMESDLNNVKVECDTMRQDRDSIQLLLDEATREMTTLKESTLVAIDIARSEEARLAEAVLLNLKQERDIANERIIALQTELNEVRASLTRPPPPPPPSTPFAQQTKESTLFESGIGSASLLSPSSFLSPQSLSRQQQNSAQLKEINKKLSMQLATKTAIIDGLQKELTRVRKSKDVITTIVNSDEAEALREERNFLLLQLQDQQKESTDLRVLVEKLSVPIVDTIESSTQTNNDDEPLSEPLDEPIAKTDVSLNTLSVAVQTSFPICDLNSKEEDLSDLSTTIPYVPMSLPSESTSSSKEPVQVISTIQDAPVLQTKSLSVKAQVFKRVIIGDVQLEWGSASPPSSPHKDSKVRPFQKHQQTSPLIFDNEPIVFSSSAISSSGNGTRDILAQLSDISTRLRAIEAVSNSIPSPTQAVFEKMINSTTTTATVTASRSASASRASDAWNKESLQKFAQKAHGPISWRAQDNSTRQAINEPFSVSSYSSITSSVVAPPPVLSNNLIGRSMSPVTIPSPVSSMTLSSFEQVPVQEKKWLTRNSNSSNATPGITTSHTGGGDMKWQERSASVPPILRTQPTPQFTVRNNPNPQQEIPQVTKREGALKPRRHAGPGMGTSKQEEGLKSSSENFRQSGLKFLGRRNSFSAEDWVTL